MILTINSNKFGSVEFLIDDNDYENLKGWSFYAWGTPRHYGIYLHGYSPDNRTQPKRIHRVIMNAKLGEIVDHINGNPSDNRRCNLRITTRKVNNQNARKRKDGKTSLFKGVCWCATAKIWRAQIQIDGVRISLGCHKTELEAAKAYDDAIIKHNSASPRNLK